MSVLTKIEAEVSAIDKTAFGAQVFRAVRLAGSAALGYVVVHLGAVASVGGVSSVIGGAVIAGEVAFRSVFPTTAKTTTPPVARPTA